MSVELYGLGEGQYLPGPDFRVQNSPNGGATGSQSFLMLRSSWQTLRAQGKFANGQRASELDENTADRGGDVLSVDSVTTADAPLGMLRVTVRYAGWSASYDGGAKSEEPTYELRGTISEKPLEEHPQMQDATVNETDRQLVRRILDGEVDWDFTNSKVILKGPGKFEYDDQPSAGIATTFCELAAQGKASFMCPSFQWTKTWEDDSTVSNAKLNNLGKVDTPEGDNPEAGGTRDWLLTSAQSISSGNGGLFRNRLVWDMSDREGWDADLYDY